MFLLPALADESVVVGAGLVCAVAAADKQSMPQMATGKKKLCFTLRVIVIV
jgi:hypothetical protein